VQTNHSTDSQQNSQNRNERQNLSWDIANLFRNYLALTLTQAVSMAFSFAAVWLVTRYLGSDGYGRLIVVISVSQLVQTTVNWTCVALARHAAEEFVKTGSINHSFWARTLILVLNLILVATPLIFFVPYISKWVNLPAEFYVFVAFHFLSQAFWLHVQHALQGAKLLKLQGALLAVERVIIVLLLLIFIANKNLTIYSALICYIIPAVCVSIIGLFSLREYLSKINISFSYIRKVLSFSLPLFPVSIVGYLSTNYLDAIFIASYLDASAAGVYSVAYQVNGIFMQLLVIANTLLMPFFVTTHSENRSDIIKFYFEKALPLLSLVFSFFYTLTAIFLAIALPVIFRNDFTESGRVLLILAMSTCFATPFLLGYSPFTNSVSATYIPMFSGIVVSLANVLGNILLIPKYGILGSAWATTISYELSVLVAATLIKQKAPKLSSLAIMMPLPGFVSLTFALITQNYVLSLIINLILSFIAFQICKISPSDLELLKKVINYRQTITKNIAQT
jgi:O-antigen/teichoic acid export membrane protein